MVPGEPLDDDVQAQMTDACQLADDPGGGSGSQGQHPEQGRCEGPRAHRGRAP